MLTVEIIQHDSRKYEITVDSWSSGVSILRCANRRAIAHLKEINDMENAIAKEIRYKNAPKKECPRCQGVGYISHYLHVAHGICFKCGGSGKVEKVKN